MEVPADTPRRWRELLQGRREAASLVGSAEAGFPEAHALLPVVDAATRLMLAHFPLQYGTTLR